jgi:YHS domain-containing protein
MRLDRHSVWAWTVVAVGSLGVAVAQAQHEHAAPAAAAPAPAPHGGALVTAGDRHFEAAFTPTGVTLYPLTADHRPLDASKLDGTVTFFHPSAPDKTWFERPLRPVAAGPQAAPTALGLAMDLANVPATGVTVRFRVSDQGQPSEFMIPFALAGVGPLSVTTSTAADREAIAAQRVCKVSGEELGSMGTPLKVSRGGQTAFLCCKGCLKRLEANPDKYLSASAPAAGHNHRDH